MEFELVLAALFFVLVFVFALLSHFGVVKQDVPLVMFGANGPMIAMIATLTPAYPLLGLLVQWLLFGSEKSDGLSYPILVGVGLLLINVLLVFYLWVTPRVPAWSVPKWYRSIHPDPITWSLWYIKSSK